MKTKEGQTKKSSWVEVGLSRGSVRRKINHVTDATSKANRDGPLQRVLAFYSLISPLSKSSTIHFTNSILLNVQRHLTFQEDILVGIYYGHY